LNKLIALLVKLVKKITPLEFVTQLSAQDFPKRVLTTTKHVRKMVFASLFHALIHIPLQTAHQRIASMMYARNVQQTNQKKRLAVDLDTGAMTRIPVSVKL